MNQILNIGAASTLDPSQAVLLMEAGMSHIFFGVLNRGDQSLHQAAFYSAGQEEPEAFMHQVFDKHPELKSSFYQVMIALHHPQSLLVPRQVYKEQSAEILMDTMHGSSHETNVIKEEVEGFDMHTVYRIPQFLYSWLNRHFSHAKFFHTYTTGIRSLNLTPEQPSQLVVDFKPNQVTVLASNQQQLQLVQIFPYEDPNDLVYFLAGICQQLGLLIQDVEVKVEGLIDASSSAYKHLEKYFHHVSFNQPAGHLLVLDERFEEYPAHYFSSLYKLAACAS